jgi:hypothetical protein
MTSGVTLSQYNKGPCIIFSKWTSLKCVLYNHFFFFSYMISLGSPVRWCPVTQVTHWCFSYGFSSRPSFAHSLIVLTGPVPKKDLLYPVLHLGLFWGHYVGLHLHCQSAAAWALLPTGHSPFCSKSRGSPPALQLGWVRYVYMQEIGESHHRDTEPPPASPIPV